MLVDAALTAVTSVLLIAVPLLTRAALRWVEVKTNIDLSDAEEAAIQKAARDAANWAEEQGHKALRSAAMSDSGRPSAATAPTKMATALTIAREDLNARKISISDEQLARAIEIAVRNMRSN